MADGSMSVPLLFKSDSQWASAKLYNRNAVHSYNSDISCIAMPPSALIVAALAAERGVMDTLKGRERL